MSGDDDHADDDHASDAHSAAVDVALPYLLVIFFLGNVTSSVLSKLPLHWWTPPYTVLVMLQGALLYYVSSHGDWGELGESTKAWSDTHPHVILMVLLPPLLFESALSMDYHVFKRVLPSSLLLAVPGVGVSIGLTACAIKAILHSYDWSWTTALLLGSILSATDPVAVVAVLKQLGAPKKLAILIEGESLLNDGTAMVAFLIFKAAAAGEETTAGGVVGDFAQLALGGFAWGYACALGINAWLHSVSDPNVQTLASVVGVFACFFLAESVLAVSGVLAVVVVGVHMTGSGKYALDKEAAHRNHTVWDEMAQQANTFIFGLAGTMIQATIQSEDEEGHELFTSTNVGLVIGMYAALHAVRAVVLALLAPALRRMGYGISLKEAAVVTWGGLRGAVGLALAALVDLEEDIPDLDRALISFHVGGIVLLTNIVNGTTAQSVYQWLRVYPTNRFHDNLVASHMTAVQADVHTRMAALKRDWFFSCADWAVVRALLLDLSDAVRSRAGELTVPTRVDVARAMAPLTAAAARQGSRRGDQSTFRERVDDAGSLQPEEAPITHPANTGSSSGGSPKQQAQHRAPSSNGHAPLQRLASAMALVRDTRSEVYTTLFQFMRSSYHSQHERQRLCAFSVALLTEAADDAQDALDEDPDGAEPLEVMWDTLQEGAEAGTLLRAVVHRDECAPGLARELFLHHLGGVARALHGICTAVHDALHEFDHMRNENLLCDAHTEVAEGLDELRRRAQVLIDNLRREFHASMRVIMTQQAAMAAMHEQLEVLEHFHHEGLISERVLDEYSHLVNHRKLELRRHLEYGVGRGLVGKSAHLSKPRRRRWLLGRARRNSASAGSVPAPVAGEDLERELQAL